MAKKDRETMCNCENSHCKVGHGEGRCENHYGDRKFEWIGELCDDCAIYMPANYEILS